MENKKYLYGLIGMVEHLGANVNTGHYVAYVRREKSKGVKAWFMTNDDFLVEEVSLEEVLKKDGYMFFYERKKD